MNTSKYDCFLGDHSPKTTDNDDQLLSPEKSMVPEHVNLTLALTPMFNDQTNDECDLIKRLQLEERAAVQVSPCCTGVVYQYEFLTLQFDHKPYPNRSIDSLRCFPLTAQR